MNPLVVAQVDFREMVEAQVGQILGMVQYRPGAVQRVHDDDGRREFAVVQPGAILDGDRVSGEILGDEIQLHRFRKTAEELCVEAQLGQNGRGIGRIASPSVGQLSNPVQENYI